MSESPDISLRTDVAEGCHGLEPPVGLNESQDRELSDDIFADIKKQEQHSGHTFVAYAPKPAQTVLTPETAEHEAPTR